MQKMGSTILRLMPALIAIAGLGACASAVHVNDRQRQLAASLTPAQAEQIIEKTFTRSEEQSGLFASDGSLYMTNPKILKMENGVVYFADHTSTITFDLWRYQMLREERGSSLFKFDMRQLRSIRIVGKGAIDPTMLRSVDGVQFALQGANGTFINLDVKRDYADEVIAVAKYYAPSVL